MKRKSNGPSYIIRLSRSLFFFEFYRTVDKSNHVTHSSALQGNSHKKWEEEIIIFCIETRKGGDDSRRQFGGTVFFSWVAMCIYQKSIVGIAWRLRDEVACVDSFLFSHSSPLGRILPSSGCSWSFLAPPSQCGFLPRCRLSFHNKGQGESKTETRRWVKGYGRFTLELLLKKKKNRGWTNVMDSWRQQQQENERISDARQWL